VIEKRIMTELTKKNRKTSYLLKLHFILRKMQIYSQGFQNLFAGWNWSVFDWPGPYILWTNFELSSTWKTGNQQRFSRRR